VRGRASALAALLALAAPAAPAPPDEKPFPVADRSMILREEKTVYLVEGRIRIPRGVEISCQKDIYIRAKGSAPAVLEVEGSFKAHGVSAREVIFEGVTVEPAAAFGKIQIDTCIFRKGGGLATAKDASVEGDLVLQAVGFEDSARCDVAMKAGSLQVLDSSGSGPLRIRGTSAEGKPNRLKAVVRGSTFYGMEASGVADLTVRINTIRSNPAVFRDCGAFQFDGNKVEAKEISFLQSKPGGFARTEVKKCDLYSPRIVFRAPADPKVGDTVTLVNCWFEGVVDREGIAARIQDAADDPGNNVRATVQNPQKRPLELAGSVNR
jgi:hypothetical protein